MGFMHGYVYPVCYSYSPLYKKYSNISRLVRLREHINPFLLKHGLEDLVLSPREWSHVEYIIDLTKPFGYATKVIGATKRTTINCVLPIYNNLLDHLDDAKARLRRKRNIHWKSRLANGVQAAHDKLTQYYGNTSQEDYYVFGFAILLDPHRKNNYWKTADFANDPEWVEVYWDHLNMYYEAHYANLDVPNVTPMCEEFYTDELDDLVEGTVRERGFDDDTRNEFSRYRDFRKLRKAIGYSIGTNHLSNSS
jgi:hypothetical protein